MNLLDLLKDPSKAEKALRKAINTGERKLAKMLIPIVKDPGLTFRYALEIAENKIKDEWEDIITKDPLYSYRYASFVLHAPFPKGEDAIATNAYSSYYYAYEVLKGPFPKGEDVIAKDPTFSYLYAANVLQKPFIKGEDVIAKDPYYSYHYARDVSKGRFVKGENVIIDSGDQEGEKNYLIKYIDFLKTINKLDEFLKDHPEVKL